MHYIMSNFWNLISKTLDWICGLQHSSHFIAFDDLDLASEVGCHSLAFFWDLQRYRALIPTSHTRLPVAGTFVLTVLVACIGLRPGNQDTLSSEGFICMVHIWSNEDTTMLQSNKCCNVSSG